MRSKQQPRPSYRWLNKDENEEGDDAQEESPEQSSKDVLSSGSASPSSHHSLETIQTKPLEQILPPPSSSILPLSTMLRDNAEPLHQELHHHHHHRQQQSKLSPHQSPIRLVHTPPPHLIDSHDDIEHSIPASFIQDPNSIAERELASPRCHSRDSSVGGRCPSDDSNYSGRSNSAAPNNTTSPIAISLPATLPPGAAASLLPPQSAAMAAYLGAAAVAAQQNRLLMSGHQMALTRNASGSPPLPMSSPIGGNGNDSSVLDFSTKRKHDYDHSPQKNCDSDSVMNLTKTDNGPLDLTVNRKRYNTSPPPPTLASQRKMPRSVDYKPPVVSPWTSPMTPYFAAAVAAASLSPKNPNVADWNGKHKMAQNDATKALEKMSELSRIGGNDVGRHTTSNSNNSNVGTVSGGSGSSGASTGRHSAWQSHWLNKGADSVKDVFKCVWCKQSFPTLETLTTHMKETQHMGVNVPGVNASGVNSGATGNSNSGQQSHHQSQSHHHQTPSSTSGGGGGNSVQSKSDLNLLIKETMPLPRKLVRGQDVWLGKGAEQTRQILKCMWCGQSFRSLSEMTTHMQQTQHYTNIISQEQIISWKSSDDTKGGGGSGNGGSGGGGQSGPNGPGTGGGGSGSGASSTVSAVLTCKVCDQAFSSLKDLSNHMVKNAHYKEHIMRSISESGGRRRQTREKRKKSLPVRKLLELERAQHEYKNGDNHAMNKTMRDIGPGRITCEKCGDKIDTIMFVEHIRQCVGGGVISPSHRNILKSSLGSNSIIPPDSISPMTPNSRDGRKSIGDDSTSPNSRHISPNATSPILKEMANIGGGGGGGSVGEKTNSPSVLNALEQLIEKSFDTRTRHGSAAGSFAANNQQSAPLGSSILKRLGIDESVDYTKPLIDPQTMNFLRNYSQQNAAQYGRRERSGSESSSVSDRGSSRMNSLTPERKIDGSVHGTPRATPDKMSHDGGGGDDEPKSLVNIKREPIDDDDHGKTINSDDQPLNISIKREVDDDDRPKSIKQEIDAENLIKRHSSNQVSSSPAPSPRQSTPGGHTTPMASPCSERSATPRSTPGASTEKKPTTTSGSLGALSSMFDSLTGNSTIGNPTDSTSQSKKGSSHPLAALQKLCDKTENTSQNSRQNSTATTQALAAPTQSNSTASGAILAFSWACNDAVMTSDSIIKCAFCDTPFCSKGAYRHHLSKVHFVKDDMIEQAAVTKPLNKRQQSTPPAHSPKSNNSHSSGGGGNGGGGGGNHCSGGGGSSSSGNNSGNSTNHSNNNSGSSVSVSATSAKSPPPSSQSQHQPGAAFEESPHSKFLKYTELAKQLSSKYV